MMWKWSDLKRIFMRKAVSDTADLGAVMWPVHYPSDMMPPKNPHITVVVFKDINNPELGYTRDDVIDAVKHTLYNNYLWIDVEGVEWFGENKDIPVLRVNHDYLYVYRNKIIEELSARGIPIDMTFPEYKPHVTMSDEAALEGVRPRKMLAGPVEVWWGDEHFRIPFNDVSVML